MQKVKLYLQLEARHMKLCMSRLPRPSLWSGPSLMPCEALWCSPPCLPSPPSDTLRSFLLPPHDAPTAAQWCFWMLPPGPSPPLPLLHCGCLFSMLWSEPAGRGEGPRVSQCTSWQLANGRSGCYTHGPGLLLYRVMHS